MQEPIRQLAEAISNAKRVAVLTGAGISAESGLRTFRGPEKDMSSLWKEFDPATLATPQAFARDPALVSKWYDWRRLGCLAAEPNAGHIALAQIEQHLCERTGDAEAFALFTQNVDRLHQRAGSQNVVELHGSIIQWRCTVTGRKHTPGPEAMSTFPPPSPFDGAGILRPDVVWFGEMLPPGAIEAADEAARTCDVFLSVGTSSVVYPAAGFIEIAARCGAKVAEINPDATPLSGIATWSIRGKAGEVLPRIVEAMKAL